MEPVLDDYTCCSQSGCFEDCVCSIAQHEICESELDASVQCSEGSRMRTSYLSIHVCT